MKKAPNGNDRMPLAWYVFGCAFAAFIGSLCVWGVVGVAAILIESPGWSKLFAFPAACAVLLLAAAAVGLVEIMIKDWREGF